ncbi:MAG: YceI family protein, partial [Candidatus Zixiibacteriota bacterium]
GSQGQLDMVTDMKTILALSFFISLSAGAEASEYHVDKAAANLVKFISDAPIEDFEGITDRIDGYVLFVKEHLAPGNDFDSSEVYFEVELNGLDTGIGLRNRHMRENYLETDIFPYAVFEGRLASVNEKSPGKFDVVTEGLMKIHGVEQTVSFDGTVMSDGNGYRVNYDFTVKLSDYNIEIPSLMFMKINEIIQIKLDFYVRLYEGGN